VTSNTKKIVWASLGLLDGKKSGGCSGLIISNGASDETTKGFNSQMLITKNTQRYGGKIF